MGVETRRVPLLDLKAQHEPIRDELLAAMARVLDSQRFILGDEVRELERAVAAYSGVRFAVGCASGSDALFLALLAVGIGPGDRVAMPPFTFFATAGAVSRIGAMPVFVDIDPVTYNIDAGRLEAAGPVRAIIPVHLFGGCADMDPINEVARKWGAVVIEDAAQAIGAEYKGRRAGSLGAVGCISFYPTKNLGACGDAGMLTTDDEALAQKLTALRVHGGTQTYYHEWVGINSRLDALQAALLRVKLPHLDSWTAQRQQNGARYHELLRDSRVTLPHPAAYQSRYIYNQFVIRCQERDRLRAYLKDHGVGTEIYYPLPLHLQTCFQNLGYSAGDFPESEKAAAEVLALPVYPGLADEDIRYVSELIRAFHR